jgi:hypothetical protein
MHFLVRTIQASALLARVEEQCLTATPTNAWCSFRATPASQLPRVIPQNMRRLSPPIALAFMERTGRYDGRKCYPWWICCKKSFTQRGPVLL